MGFSIGLQNAQDNKAVIFNLHAPTNVTSPLGTRLDKGRLFFLAGVNKDSNPQNNQTTWTRLYDQPVGNLDGKWQAYLYHFKLSPNAGEGSFFHVYRRVDGGQWTQLVNHNSPQGYDYGTDDINHFFPISLNYYQYHNWGNTTDPNYPLRELSYGYTGVLKNPVQSLGDMRSHLDAFMPSQ